MQGIECSHRETIGRWCRSGLLLSLLALHACRGDSPPATETTERPLKRFAGGQGALSSEWPTATIDDDTRYVLRSPPRAPLSWGIDLEDRSGNRIYRLERELTPNLHSSEALLVTTSVKIGADWVEPPPRRLEIDRSRAVPSVELDIGIPANPGRRKITVSAQAWGIGAVDLSDIRTEPSEIPPGATLEFSLGALEPKWSTDRIHFSLEACESQRCEEIFSEDYAPASGWVDRRLALDHWAGRRVAFRFRAQQLEHESPFSFPVWGNPTLYAREPRRTEQTNVILLSIDTLRADHLTSYGYRHDTAPFIEERFARGGTVFDNLVSSATITTPSHASMFTALSPAAHGAVHGVKRLPLSIPTLPELARRHGIATAAMTENGWINVSQGFGRGFDRFVENKSADINAPDGQVDRTLGQARQWLEQNHDKHFFLFLHTFQVHSPYAPPAGYRHLFMNPEAASGGLDIFELLYWTARYDQEIRYTDDEIAKLFATIDRLGLGRNTVFILTSDHGEAFLEHGVLGHGSRLDNEMVHVPLMLWGRGIPVARRIDPNVSHTDLMPTILDLLGIEMPPGREGLSLRALLQDTADKALFENRPVYSESRLGYAATWNGGIEAFPTPSFMVRLGDLKLSRYPQSPDKIRYELYDLSIDPKERNNIYAGSRKRAEPLVELAEEYDRRGRRIRTEAGAGEEDAEGQRVRLELRQQEKLRALGYLDTE